MNGFFGVTPKENRVPDVSLGIGYYPHLGTRRGGMAIHGEKGFIRIIHNIENPSFRTKFEKDIEEFDGNLGVGRTSDNETQPLLVESYLDSFVITTVGRINNLEGLQSLYFERGVTYFLEMNTGETNPTELTAPLTNHKATIIEGLQYVQGLVKGNTNILLITQYGTYAARDLLGRIPIALGEREMGFYTTFESSVLLNLGYHHYRDLGVGEIVFITPECIEVLQKPREEIEIHSSLWAYYGYPTSTHGGVNVECMRDRYGELFAGCDGVEMDSVVDVPDSRIVCVAGYSNASSMSLARLFIKYTPMWPRSFISTGQM